MDPRADPADHVGPLTAAQGRLEEAAEALAAAQRARDQQVYEAWRTGLEPREIAAYLGVRTQTVTAAIRRTAPAVEYDQLSLFDLDGPAESRAPARADVAGPDQGRDPDAASTPAGLVAEAHPRSTRDVLAAGPSPTHEPGPAASTVEPSRPDQRER